MGNTRNFEKIILMLYLLVLIIFPLNQAAGQNNNSKLEDCKKINYICSQRFMCMEYYRARQDCATAGNINECISIKMGKDAFQSKTFCNNNGDYDFDKPEIGTFECLLRKAAGENYCK